MPKFTYFYQKPLLMIEQPPKIRQYNVAELTRLLQNEDINNLVLDINSKYLYWSDIKYKQLPDGLTPQKLWKCVKFTRTGQMLLLWGKYNLKVPFTPAMQSMCHDLDMEFGGFWGSSSKVDEKARQHYLVSSVMEEAIASSIMEGASTTRRKAKEMLRKGITPKTKSERMVFNNYESIRFIIDHKNDPLTTELLLSLHKNMTRGTLDDSVDEGRFRDNDEVVVADGITNEVFHDPPHFEDIPQAIELVCQLFNNQTPRMYIHPILKGIIIHFIISYVHPFVDGNGRTARALFYWYLLKSDYWLIQYISISKIIASSKRQYEKSFLYVENDGNDLGYFIIYNLRVLALAFKDLKAYIERKSKEMESISSFEKRGNINRRQAGILQTFLTKPTYTYSIKELTTMTGVTRQTIQADVNKLVEMGALRRIRVDGKQSVYGKGDKYEYFTQEE